MSPVRRKDYTGLFIAALVSGVGQVGLGAAFVLSGNATSSPPWEAVRSIFTAVGLPQRLAILAWAALLVGGGLATLTTTLYRRCTLLHMGVSLQVNAVLWVMLATVFGVYALEHSWLGVVGAILWATGGAWTLAAGLTATGYWNDPRPRRRT